LYVLFFEGMTPSGSDFGDITQARDCFEAVLLTQEEMGRGSLASLKYNVLTGGSERFDTFPEEAMRSEGARILDIEESGTSSPTRLELDAACHWSISLVLIVGLAE
jgi:hypothetical protein